MLIESAGYKGIYLDKVLAVGYSSNNLNSFIKQRKRWAAGCIQMEYKFPILKQKGLNIKQKCEYISCISYWFFSIKVFLFLIAPILYSLFKIVLINSYAKIFLIMWLPQYITKRFLLDIVYEKTRSSTWNKIYETILFPALFITCIKETIGIRKKHFDVTEKETKKAVKNTDGIRLSIIHFLFLIINIISYYISFRNKQVLPLLFSIINIFYLVVALIFDLNNKSELIENVDKLKTDCKYKFSAILSIFLRR